MNQLINELKKIVGDEYVITDKAGLIPYSRDYSPISLYLEVKKLKISYPKIAVQPGTIHELQQILEIIPKYKVKMGVYGGGSGVLQAYTPDVDLVIDLCRLNWIRWYDEESRILYLGPGAYLIEVEEWLGRRGYTLGHYPQSIHVTTVGGAVATGSIGMYSSGYGGIEDLIVGVEIATPRYGIIRYGPVVRGNIPLPLDKLMVNSEGRFGVITGVYLKVFRKPDITLKGVVKIKSFYDGVEILRRIIDYRVYPHLIRLFDEYESSIYFHSDKPVLIYGLHGYNETLELLMNWKSTLDRIVDGEHMDDKYYDEWVNSRYRYIDYIHRLYKMGIIVDTMEYGVPWSRVKKFNEEIRGRLLENPGIVYLSSHISHIHTTGCGIYYTLGIDSGSIQEEYMNIWRIALETAIENGCDISHHHGIGRIRYEALKRIYGEAGVKLIDDISRLLGF